MRNIRIRNLMTRMIFRHQFVVLRLEEYMNLRERQRFVLKFCRGVILIFMFLLGRLDIGCLGIQIRTILLSRSMRMTS